LQRNRLRGSSQRQIPKLQSEASPHASRATTYIGNLLSVIPSWHPRKLVSLANLSIGFEYFE
jgi:hypothetical protein